MLIDKNKIQNINSVKEEAEKAAKTSHLDKYQIAKSILERKSFKYDIEEIKSFWNYRPTAHHKNIISKTKESKPPIDKQTINCDNSFEDVDNLDLSGKSPKKFLSSTSGMM